MYLFQQAQHCHGLDKKALVHGSYLHMLSGTRPYFLSSHRSITLSVLQCVGQQKAVRLNDSTVRVQAEAGAAGARGRGVYRIGYFLVCADGCYRKTESRKCSQNFVC